MSGHPTIRLLSDHEAPTARSIEQEVLTRIEADGYEAAHITEDLLDRLIAQSIALFVEAAEEYFAERA